MGIKSSALHSVKVLSGWTVLMRVINLARTALLTGDVVGTSKEVLLVGAAPHDFRSESFQVALERHGLTSAQLAVIENVFERRVRVLRIATYVAIGFSLLYLFLWPGLLFVVGMGSSIVVFVTLLFRTSLRLWQIRRKSFGTVTEFIKDGGLHQVMVRND